MEGSIDVIFRAKQLTAMVIGHGVLIAIVRNLVETDVLAEKESRARSRGSGSWSRENGREAGHGCKKFGPRSHGGEERAVFGLRVLESKRLWEALDGRRGAGWQVALYVQCASGFDMLLTLLTGPDFCHSGLSSLVRLDIVILRVRRRYSDPDGATVLLRRETVKQTRECEALTETSCPVSGPEYRVGRKAFCTTRTLPHAYHGPS